MILTFLANTGLGSYAVQNKKAPTSRAYVQTIQGCDYLLTFNGGRTWKPLGPEGFHALSIAPPGDVVWAVGENGRVARLDTPSKLGARRP